MRISAPVRHFLPIVLLAVSGASALDPSGEAGPSPTEIRAESDALLDHARAMIAPDAPVFVVPCCQTKVRFDASELRKLEGRKFYLMIPRETSPFDVVTEVSFSTETNVYRTVQLVASDNEAMRLWWTIVRAPAIRREDYFLSLQIGGFRSRAEGRLTDSNALNWRQNNEYRLLALSAPLDPADPAFSLILEDQLLVSVTTLPNPDGLVPIVRPTFDFRAGNVGVSVSGGAQARYKISVGGGYALSVLPSKTPNSGAQGFFRFQIRFK